MGSSQVGTHSYSDLTFNQNILPPYRALVTKSLVLYVLIASQEVAEGSTVALPRVAIGTDSHS